MRKHFYKYLLPSICLLSNIAIADDPGTPPNSSQELKLPDSSISDFPGEQFIIHNQTAKLIYRDIVIPGPNGLNINIGRSTTTGGASPSVPEFGGNTRG